jgi:membrane protease YdiL (CAAX protease family)
MTARSSEERPPWRRRLIIYALVLAIFGVGMLLKRPFGLFLFHLLGRTTSGPHTPLQWAMSDAGSVCIVAAGLLLHDRSGLPAAPGLERLLFKDARRAPRPAIWRPGLVGALASLAVFFAVQAWQSISGAPAAPLTAKLAAGAVPHAQLLTLAALYPLAVVGAGLSEEVIYRFGLMSVLIGLMSWARVGGRQANNAWAFWIANVLQAAWFGFGHVAQGLVASQSGGAALATLAAPQTWSGLIFGYVYRRWGLEAAIIAHMASDLLVPVVLACWRLALGR